MIVISIVFFLMSDDSSFQNLLYTYFVLCIKHQINSEAFTDPLERYSHSLLQIYVQVEAPLQQVNEILS